jgi:hypothetical protein
MPGHNGFRFDNYESISPARVTRRSVLQKSRSGRLSLGRGCFRLKTASCCRSAAASNASLWRVTNKARMYVTTAMTSEPIALMLVEAFASSNELRLNPLVHLISRF